MPGYVFLSNSNKPTTEQQNSREKVTLTNVSRPCLQSALDMGYEVYFGINRANPDGLECELPVHLYDSHTYRSITAFKDNYIAFKNLMEILNTKDIEVIHCNTPVGGMIGRLCAHLKGIKHVIYTAHGFHFYKGAPLFNNTIIKWAEMLMAHWTDAIITMNQEDFAVAQKFKLRKKGKVYYIPGVGIDTKDIQNLKVNTLELRKSLGLRERDIVCISMGDLILRKNYSTAIRAIAKCNNPNIHYLICGDGPELDNLKCLADELGIAYQVHFLGFRKDVKELLKISDIFLFTTLQEGMPRSMMEAMASGLPCIASNIRGNVDLIEDNIGGFLLSPNDVNGFSEKIDLLAKNSEMRQAMSQANLKRIGMYDIKIVKKKMYSIYKEICR